MKKPFRWLIIQYAQKPLDAKHWHKHMLPALMKMNQYRNVEIDLIYCPASGRPERAKWGKGKNAWIFYHFKQGLAAPLKHQVSRQPFLRLLHSALKDKPRHYYDGFMYGGHSNGEKIGLRPIRLASIQQFGRFLRRHKFYFSVIAFDSCCMGNELLIKQIQNSCEYLLASPSDSPYTSLLQMASLHKKSPKTTLRAYLKRIATDYMKHTTSRFKYPCLLLFHVKPALRAYRLMHLLKKRKLIEWVAHLVDYREKFYVHDPYVASRIRKEWEGAVSDPCGHIIKPCKKHRPLNESQRKKQRAQLNHMANINK